MHVVEMVGLMLLVFASSVHGQMVPAPAKAGCSVSCGAITADLLLL